MNLHSKCLASLTALAVILFPASLAVASAVGLGAGGPSLRLEPGQAATRAPAFTGNFYQPRGTGGVVVDNTAIFTGQPSYRVPLHVLQARDGIGFPLVISYSGPTFPTMENNNDRSPAGWIGAGWSLNVPFVAINHKGTRTYADDVIFCSLGPQGGGQILREPETGRYFLATAPGIRIAVDTVANPASPLYGQIKSWTFTLPQDGTRLVFGHAGIDTVHDSERTVRHAGGMIVASPFNAGSAKPFIYRWDIRRMEDDSRTTGIDFEHRKFAEPLWGGHGYTRESHLSRVIWKDPFGNEIRRADLELHPLDSGEFAAQPPQRARSSQRLFETQRLGGIAVYHEDVLHVRHVLEREVVDTPHGKKGLLLSVTPVYGEDAVSGPAWVFAYRDGDRLLEEITRPSGAREAYDYEDLDLSGTSADQEQYGSLFRRENGEPVTPEGEATRWFTESHCDDRFCHEVLRYNKQGGRDTVYFRITHNTGNYFDSGTVHARTLHAQNTKHDEWQFLRNGNYFVVADNRHGTVELWEWNGRGFSRADTVAGMPGDPLRGNFGGKIQVFATGKYLLVYRNESTRRLWVYMREPYTGTWKNLTAGSRSDPSCTLDNPPQGAKDPRPDTDCFTWKWNLRIAAGESMFAVHDEQENLVYWYALNAAGNGFESIGHLIPFLPGAIQETYGGNPVPQNWNRKIVDFRLAGDHLIVKSRKEGPLRSRYDLFFYDGSTIRRTAALEWERDHLGHAFNASNGTRHDRNLWPAGDYFIHANTHPAAFKRIEYWRKHQNPDSLYFEPTDTLRTDIPHEGSLDSRIVAAGRYVSVEYYPSDSFRRSLQPDQYPILSGGKYASWIYRIDEAGDISALHDSLYTIQWPGGACATRMWNVTLALTDNVLFGSTARGDPPACHCVAACFEERYSIRLNNGSNDGFLREKLYDPTYTESYFLHNSLSAGERLASWLRITKQTGEPDLEHVYSRRFFFDGRGYAGPPETSVVRRFVRHAVPDAAHPALVTEFTYVTDPDSAVVVFNHNTQTARFERVRIIRDGAPGGSEYVQFTDHPGHKLLLDSASLSGRVHAVHAFNAGGDTISWSATGRDPSYSRGWQSPGVRDSSVEDPWPRGVASIRTREALERRWADNRSYRTTVTRFHVYDDALEIPRFTVREQGDRVSILQTILAEEREKVRMAFDYPASAVPSDSVLRTHASAPLSTDAVAEKYAVGRSEVAYDPFFRFKVNKIFGWRDPGGEWTNEELEAGPVPAFNPEQGLFVASEVTLRDSLGQALEVRSETSPESYKYASFFYGGRAALPVATIVNARRDNVSVLTAASGSVPQLLSMGTQGKLDLDTLWNAAGAIFVDHQTRTGRHSILVNGSAEPSTDIRLRDVHTGKFGYVVTAWIRGETAQSPVVRVSRHHENGSVQDDTTAAPVDGTYQQGEWQRWEVKIPHARLVADGMFQQQDEDYLRVTVGTGGGSAFLYADNVVCRPDNSMFSLTAYNGRGQPTHATDTYHRTRIHEYSVAGKHVATRDERGRVFSQQGINRVGENLP